MGVVTSRPRAVHQFHPSVSFGDGVTNAMLFTRALLRELGFDSEIYADEVPAKLAPQVHRIAAYRDAPDQCLLLHHSIGHDLDAWVEGLAARLLLVYHNITPEEHLDDDPVLRRYVRIGRQQLERYRDRAEAAIAVSEFNAADLRALGFREVSVIPLLVDLDAIRRRDADHRYESLLRRDPSFKVLFVGRIIEHKAQRDLVLAVSRLGRRLRRPVRLILAGRTVSQGYHDALVATAEGHGLADAVDLAGLVSDERLHALYRCADAYLSMSRHEGFGMPLIEAMAVDLPVVAYAAGAVADTMGEGGLLLREPDPAHAAVTLGLLADEPALRRRVLDGQRRNLARFERPVLVEQLRALLGRLGIEAGQAGSTGTRAAEPGPLDARIEGPFDSSYSLALVNRELALAFERRGRTVGLRATEGTGDYPPDRGFLSAHPEIATLAEAGEGARPARAVLRNLYPPRTDDMRGDLRVFAGYAWEESGFPAAAVEAFNASLDLITVPSRFVAKTLIDNGVRTPIAVVGHGADHLGRAAPAPLGQTLPAASFRFLHVSSCFPRKGPDVLLEAWSRAFSKADDVALVIKTFPNPHNDVARRLEALRGRNPDLAEVALIEQDYDAGRMRALFEQCHALVAPSRGEGFGLPLAEAALFDLPVITTALGGQTEFCTESTAWLVDARFARSQSHLGLFDSVWAEPGLDALVRALRAVFDASPIERARRTRAMRALVEDRYRWDAVAARTEAALGALDRLPAVEPLGTVAWVTSWNTRCGIAAYARHLASAFPPSRLRILASHPRDRIRPDEPNVLRCWAEHHEVPLDELYEAIRACGAEAAVIQFNFGFFGLGHLGRLLERLARDGVHAYLFMHSTADAEIAGRNVSLREIARPLSTARRIFVHGPDDLNRLKGLGLVENVCLFPHGVLEPRAVDAAAARARRGLTGKRVLASFGFMLPHKGLRELVEAFAQLRQRHDDLHLLMLNGLYPDPASEGERRACLDLIKRHRLGDAVTLISDFLPEDEALALLALAEAVVFPYQDTQESASGAVRFGLASGRPVLCTPLAIFDDVGDAVHRAPGRSPADIAAACADVLDRRIDLDALAERQAAWVAAHGWSALSRRLENIIRSCGRAEAWARACGEAEDGAPAARAAAASD